MWYSCNCLWQRGVLETVKPVGYEAPTGVFFGEQNINSLIGAVNQFESSSDNFYQRIAGNEQCIFQRNVLKVKLKTMLCLNGICSARIKLFIINYDWI